ncbi:X-linked lymphocyte-regulated protein PM1 [Mesocricetus auratus]|uniref:X-linked lymphocyte-regulated protein PM1 n=1 Tax=Mesocricetus auratus TaxID=10036 RepID=A0A3Q0CBA9_MESAU|nr:X-linked lymphocyte-regulated protein PM1 [Mesocricetus auratus]
MEIPCVVIDDGDEEQDGHVSQRDIFEAQKQVPDNHERAKSKEIVGDTGAQVQSILKKFGDDINKALHVKRKHMETYVKDCIKGSNQKLKQVWKMKARERKKINSEFSKQCMTAFQQWDMDIQKLDEEQENLANNFQKQRKALKLSKTDQKQSLQAIRELHEKFMESLVNLETNNYVLLTNVEGELKKEISAFQKNLTRQTLKYCLPYKTSD